MEITEEIKQFLISQGWKPPTNGKVNMAYFEQFWTTYPRKIAKKETLKIFSRINPNEKLFNSILEGLNNYIKSDQWREKKFIPHPATFLNQARWEDEIEKGGEFVQCVYEKSYKKPCFFDCVGCNLTEKEKNK